jgi:hypothetical protein
MIIKKLEAFDNKVLAIDASYYKGKKAIPKAVKKEESIFSDEEEEKYLK